ncbi:MAG: carboxylating nicotinate-nucleotide diphosphorylase [Bacteroidales bacterium]|nr:carboxylating nicotinate-nucleotide diphosphorylase [Bacteroidales bacterium]MBS3774256.1 carboxylating nicotinate-nucleotide diphosphorylase [Bacteroidales bacterium]
MKLNNNHLQSILELAVKEDIGDGDHSSLACIPKRKQGTSQLLIKEKGIIAGIDIARRVFDIIDPNLRTELYISDGNKVNKADIAFQVKGKVRSILQAERPALNFLQRMSGIATQTRLYADKLKDLNTKVLDTRKTTPGLRILEKQAVALGGGSNHRMGLYDMIMLKDNHIDFAGSIDKAIRKTLKYLHKQEKNLKIEVEVRNLEEVREVMQTGGVDRIMLDNFNTEDTKRAVELINGMFETESSGNITLENIRQYAECGVDYISVGALTHQIKSLDMSLKAIDF